MVVLFSEDTPSRLLTTLRPDVLIKGANYHPEDIVGSHIVRNYGGAVRIAEIQPFAHGKKADVFHGAFL